MEDEKITFIEGVGNNAAYMVFNANLNPFLLCTKKDDAIVYETQNLTYDNVCESPTAITFLKNCPSFLKIYPNPATDYFEIVFNDELVSAGEKTRLFIFDALGNIVYSEERTVASLSKKINTFNWAKGLYYIQIQSNSFNYISPIIFNLVMIKK